MIRTFSLEKDTAQNTKIELFDYRFYFTNVRQIPDLRFFVCYIAEKSKKPTAQWNIYARIVYKDLSLVWRAASHFTFLDEEIWIGKGDVRVEMHGDEEMLVSNEATTDLPIEMQSAIESLLAWKCRASSNALLSLVLRKAGGDRLEPYRDFVEPRERAASNKGNLINRGRSVAKFTRKNDPKSLVIAKGFEPDFLNGIIEQTDSFSKLYGGRLTRFRILSTNKKIQYYFFAGPKHVWIVPPQATNTELSSYGVRTIDVEADDDLFIPGYEYHHYEETPNGPELYSQIPIGFAGGECPFDDAKADASPWLDKIPVVQSFRRNVLGS